MQVGSGFPTQFANMATPYAPVGRLPVGQENPEARTTPLKPVIESNETSRADLKRDEQSLRDADLHQQVLGRVNERDEQQSSGQQQDQSADQAEQSADQQEDSESEQQQRLLQQQQAEIQQLASRDREVRAHEQAHVAAAGGLAGSASYEYTRGPDGVAYAVAGEVPISLGQVPGDPEATLANAQRVQDAALAPAEPSSQDYRVAAQAAQMEQQALQEIAELARQERLQYQAEDEQSREAEKLEREDLEAQREASEQRRQAELAEDTARQADISARNIDIQQRLIDIGVVDLPRVGTLFSQSV